MFIDILLVVFVICIAAFVLTGVTHIIVDVPYVRTPRKVAEEMVRIAGLRGGETVYDLGAGDGQLLVTAKRLCPTIRAIGVELVPTVWLLGKLHVWLSGQHIDFRLGNGFKQPLHDADVLFLYVTPKFLRGLESKFDAELKPGTKIISHTFRFPSKHPIKEVSSVF